MAKKKIPEVSPGLRRKALEADVAAFIAAGNKIEEIPSGVSSQDPQGRGKQLRLGANKTEQQQEEQKQQAQPTKE